MNTVRYVVEINIRKKAPGFNHHPLFYDKTISKQFQNKYDQKSMIKRYRHDEIKRR